MPLKPAPRGERVTGNEATPSWRTTGCLVLGILAITAVEFINIQLANAYALENCLPANDAWALAREVPGAMNLTFEAVKANAFIALHAVELLAVAGAAVVASVLPGNGAKS